jgi:hypothetical protein
MTVSLLSFFNYYVLVLAILFCLAAHSSPVIVSEWLWINYKCFFQFVLEFIIDALEVIDGALRVG